MGQLINNQPEASPSTINFEHPTIVSTVHFLADRVIGSYGFNESDREDIEQDLRTDLVAYAASYNPEESSWATFAIRVLNGALCDAITARQAKKRQRIDEQIITSVADGDQIKNDHVFVDPVSGRAQHQHELRMDVTAILADLPEQNRRIAELLMHETPSDVARILGIKRYLVYESIAIIKKAFTKAGLALTT